MEASPQDLGKQCRSVKYSSYYNEVFKHSCNQGIILTNVGNIIIAFAFDTIFVLALDVISNSLYTLNVYASNTCYCCCL